MCKLSDNSSNHLSTVGSSHSRDGGKMIFEGGWLLNTSMFSVEMNIWDHSLLTFKAGSCLIEVITNLDLNALFSS